QNAISESSFLIRAAKLTTKEVENITKSVNFYKPEQLSEFYGNIYGTLNLKDAAERMRISRSKWVSTAATLLRLGLLLSPEGKNLKSTAPAAPAQAAVPLPPRATD